MAYRPGDRQSKNIEDRRDEQAVTDGIPAQGVNSVFAGYETAHRLASNGFPQPLAALRAADKMRKEGATRVQIHRATSKMLNGTDFAGVHHGRDGLPRFEITDHGMKLNKASAIPAGRSGLMADLITHDQLYRAAPSAAMMSVAKNDGNGSAIQGTHVELGAKHFGSKPLGGREMAQPSVLGPALHELQHHVQDIEGFDPGGAPSDFAKKYPGNTGKQVAAYTALAGENEAEMARIRRNLTPEQRRANMPEPLIPFEHQTLSPHHKAYERTRELVDMTSVGDAVKAAYNTLMNREIADGKIIRFRKLDPSKIKADAATFQFKSGGDTKGVTDRLKGVTEWDPVAAGKSVVFERLNGELVIADGHQRRGLAERLQANGAQGVRMDSYVMREADGWTPKDVRAYAALKNMKESSGTPLDMAKVMRDRPDLVNGSLPLSDAKIKDAMALSKLSQPAFDSVVGGVIKPEYAVAVGAADIPASRHADLLAEMSKANLSSAQHARLYVSQAMAAPQYTETTGSLFGEETNTRSLLAERAKVLDRALQALKSDKRIFGLLEREAGNIEGAGNKLAHEANAERATSAGRLSELVEKLATSRGPVSDMLDKAATAMAEGKSPSVAARGFVKSVGDTMKAGGVNALLGTAPAAEPVVHDANQMGMFGEPAPAGEGRKGWGDEARAASAGARKREMAFGGDLPKGYSVKPIKSGDYTRYQIMYKASPLGRSKQVGEAMVRTNFRNPDGTVNSQVARINIQEAHTRKGIATALYAHIERDTGHKLIPDSTLSKEAAGLWEKHRPEALFDHKKLKDGGAVVDPLGAYKSRYADGGKKMTDRKREMWVKDDDLPPSKRQGPMTDEAKARAEKMLEGVPVDKKVASGVQRRAAESASKKAPPKRMMIDDGKAKDITEMLKGLSKDQLAKVAKSYVGYASSGQSKAKLIDGIVTRHNGHLYDAAADAQAMYSTGIGGALKSGGGHSVGAASDHAVATSRAESASLARLNDAIKSAAPKGQASFLPDASTKEQIAAASKAKGRKGGNEAPGGLFSDARNQTDLVDMARAAGSKPAGWQDAARTASADARKSKANPSPAKTSEASKMTVDTVKPKGRKAAKPSQDAKAAEKMVNAYAPANVTGIAEAKPAPQPKAAKAPARVPGKDITALVWKGDFIPFDRLARLVDAAKAELAAPKPAKYSHMRAVRQSNLKDFIGTANGRLRAHAADVEARANKAAAVEASAKAASIKAANAEQARRNALVENARRQSEALAAKGPQLDRVAAYNDRLNAALGNSEAHAAVMAEIKSDKAMTASDLKRIAKVNTGATAKSGAMAMNLLTGRQSILDIDKAKASAMGGRTAAMYEPDDAKAPKREMAAPSRAAKQVTAADFDFSKAKVYRKTATLSADQIAVAKGGESVVTRQKDKAGSYVETTNVAKPGDRIITRSPGDSYVVAGDKFAKLYEPHPEQPGVFRSNNVGKAVRVTRNVEIMAPWGEKQLIKKGGVIFQSMTGEVYGNAKETFNADFKPEKASSGKRGTQNEANQQAIAAAKPVTLPGSKVKWDQTAESAHIAGLDDKQLAQLANSNKARATPNMAARHKLATAEIEQRQSSGLRGTQNEANREAIAANRKSKAIARTKAAMPDAAPVALDPAKLADARLESAKAKLAVAQSMKEPGPRKTWAAAGIHDAEQAAKRLDAIKPPDQHTGEPRAAAISKAESIAADARAEMKGGKATPFNSLVADTMEGRAARLKQGGNMDTANHDAGPTPTEKALAAPPRQAAYQGEPGAKGIPTAKSRQALLREAAQKGIKGPNGEHPRLLETRTLANKLGYSLKYAAGPLAVVGIAAAMTMGANKAKAEGLGAPGQVKEAVKEGGKGLVGLAAFSTAGALIAKGLVKGGVTAAKAVPVTGAILMAGGAAVGAYDAMKAGGNKADIAKGAAKGAWDMSVPGMLVNTGVAVKEAVRGRMTADQAAQFQKANAEFNAKQQAAMPTGQVRQFERDRRTKSGLVVHEVVTAHALRKD